MSDRIRKAWSRIWKLLVALLLATIAVGACHDVGHGVQGMGGAPSPDIRFFVIEEN